MEFWVEGGERTGRQTRRRLGRGACRLQLDNDGFCTDIWLLCRPFRFFDTHEVLVGRRARDNQTIVLLKCVVCRFVSCRDGGDLTLAVVYLTGKAEP